MFVLKEGTGQRIVYIDCPPARFHQHRSYLFIPTKGLLSVNDLVSTAMASGDQTEIGRELLLVPEASYIFHFCQNGHTAYRSYSRNAVNEVITIGILR